MAKKSPNSGKITTTITLDIRQDTWLREHIGFNLSAFVRERLDELTRGERKTDEEIAKEAFAEMLTEKWKQKGTVSNETRTKEDILIMIYLLESYRFECLGDTLREVDNEIDKWYKGGGNT